MMMNEKEQVRSVFSADQNTQTAERVKTAFAEKAPERFNAKEYTKKKGIHVCSAETRVSCYFLMVNDSIVGLTNAARE